MNRRKFMATLGAVAAATLSRAQSEIPSLTIDVGAAGPTIPSNFAGLSFESAQLANPEFFSPRNQRLIELVRGLSPGGNLRIGGNSSEYTTYSDSESPAPVPFDSFSPATSKVEKKDTVTTAFALRNLRGFLDATGWNCLYGLNLGRGTKDNAVAEAAAVQRILGPRLLALQIGNEPDSFRNRYRPAEYGPEQYIEEWRQFHDAIVKVTPSAKFAGPDISNKFAFLTAFAAEASKHPDVILLTGHYYGMGPAGSPDATLDQLFEADSHQATMHPAQAQLIQDARKQANLPYRMSEGNSCWDGGKPGVSNTLASALWCANMMLRFAQMGWVGVNLHGGGESFYTPIAGRDSASLTKRPEYFGIQFAQHFVGAVFQPVTLHRTEPRVTAYALRANQKLRVAVFNPYEISLGLRLPRQVKTDAWLLTGPSLASPDGTTFGPVRVNRSSSVLVPAHSAAIYEL